ncbi:amino acid adenylation domain-containing protein [Marinomonas sp. PE14-40]|uniref:amino acid adenylation domain-containing protein n=1 Tax=Marinomonas sp. PE14-40 TaxID=3060621 RepID=UPI003F6708C2
MDKKNNKPLFDQNNSNKLISIFKQRVTQFGDHNAIECNDKATSYRELDAISDILAQHLIKNGVKQGDRVAVCLPRSLSLCVSLLAITKCGACYLPLDPDAPIVRQKTMLSLAKVELGLGNIPSELGVKCIDIETNEVSLFNTEETTSFVARDLTQDFCLFFTSGTTGIPKGVPIHQDAILNLVITPGYVDISANDRVASWANPTFDAQLFEIWGALLNGACLVIFNQAELIETDAFAQKLQHSELDYAFMTASLFNYMVTKYPQEIISIKHLLVGGEALSPQSCMAFYQAQAGKTSKSRLYNAYGPTECTTFSLCHKLDESRLEEYITNASVPIGKVIGKTKVIILNKTGDLAKTNEVGDLYLAGPSLTKGYISTDSEANKVFIKLAYKANKEQDSHVWYKTGDLAKRNDKSEIEYLGRADDQVKIRGHRVETAEIDNHLVSYPNIKQAVTLGVDSGLGYKDLYTYIVTAQGANEEISSEETSSEESRYQETSLLNKDSVLAYLKEELPTYMLPHRLFVLAKLPLNANGKLDREVLARLELSELASSQTPTTRVNKEKESLNELRNTLAKIAPIRGNTCVDLLLKALNQSELSLEKGFIQTGGDSLKAMHLSSSIKRAFSIQLSVRDILESETMLDLMVKVEQLPELLKELEGNTASPSTNIKQYVATKQQLRLFFLQQIEPDSKAYYAPYHFFLEKGLSVSVLEWAWSQLLVRHTGLTSQFKLNNNQLMVSETCLVMPLKVCEIKQAEVDTELERFMKAPFDLEKGPLAKACLFDISDPVNHQAKQILSFNFHHLIIDGWSLNLILDELSQLYQSGLKQETNTLNALNKNYGQYSQDSHKAGNQSNQDDENFWLTQFKAYSNKNLLFPTSLRDSKKGAQLHSSIDSTRWESIEHFVKTHNVTLFSLLLGAYYLALAKIFDNKKIPIGSPIANRQSLEDEAIVGMFANTSIFHLKESSKEGQSDFINYVQDLVIDTLSHQNLDFQQISELSMSLGNKAPLFEALFVLENTDLNNFKLADQTIQAVTGFAGDAKFPISLYLIKSHDSAELCLEYQISCINQTKAKAILDHFIMELDGLTDYQPTDISLPKSRASFDLEGSLNFEKTHSDLEFDLSLSFIDMFEQQVARAPDSTALIWKENAEDRGLTYKALNLKANQLAHYLKRLGYQQGDILGLASAWSPSSCLAILAIAKIGACYLPLDHRNPKNRTVSMLSNAGVKSVLGNLENLQNLSEALTLIPLDDANHEALIKEEVTYNPARANDAINELAYIIYTSGSTGEPKGVMVTQANITNLLISMRRMLDVSDQDTFMNLTAPSFDIHVTEIYLPLICGAKLAMLTWEEAHTPQLLSNRQKHYGVSLMQATPATWQLLVDIGWKPSKGLKMLTGGDHLSLPLKNALIVNEARLFNLYGPSETSVYCSAAEMTKEQDNIHIGKALENNRLYILDESKKMVARGEMGELYISGANVGRGYLNNQALTHIKFTSDPFISSTSPFQTMYQSGDLARRGADGNIELVGRKDFQIKVNGFRIETGEVETCLLGHESVSQALVTSIENENAGSELLAYVVRVSPVSIENNQEAELITSRGSKTLRTELSKMLMDNLPSFMQPSYIMVMDEFPLTLNGKVDRHNLPTPNFKDGKKTGITSQSKINQTSSLDKNTELDKCSELNKSKELNRSKEALVCQLHEILTPILGYQIDQEQHFFEAGMNSILMMKFHHALTNAQIASFDLSLMTLLDTPNLNQLAEKLNKNDIDQDPLSNDPSLVTEDIIEEQTTVSAKANNGIQEIAVIGMAVNLPQANNLQAFWQLIKNGTCAIKVQDEKEDRSDRHWVNSVSSIQDVFDFDPHYFGISINDAKLMDPQHRHALMTSAQALADAGITSDGLNKVGVVFSQGDSDYQTKILSKLENKHLDKFHLSLLNEKDFIATRLAYHLNLKGPAISVQTACSSSLVAIHQACQQLLNGDSQVCLAGGVNIDLNLLSGYPYREGMILSKTGLCRPFSDDADGTVPANGVAAVVLKPLVQAIQDQDTIYATIKASAINNDGSDKVSYFAPSLSGQIEVIKTALKRAEIEPFEVGYIEAHGTGTLLGDPIEVSALSQALESVKHEHNETVDHQDKRYLGTLKSQMGHLGAAAGVAGFIRTALSLYHKKTPASLHVNTLNTKIDFIKAGFEISPQMLNQDMSKPYAGISSFGIGGTNAHLIMGQSPNSDSRNELKPPKIEFNKRSYVSDLFNHYKSVAASSLNDETSERTKSKAVTRFKQLAENDWFLQENWLRGESLEGNNTSFNKHYVLIDNPNQQGRKLAEKLSLFTQVSYFSNLDDFVKTLEKLDLETLEDVTLLNFNQLASYSSTASQGLYNDLDLAPFDFKQIFNDWNDLINLIQSKLINHSKQTIKIINLVQGSAQILGDESLNPTSALLFGLLQTCPIEFENLKYTVLDIPPTSEKLILNALLKLESLSSGHYAIRGHYLWQKHYQRSINPPNLLSESDKTTYPKALDKKGKKEKVYVLTGIGGIGEALIKHLSQDSNNKLICLSRSSASNTLDIKLAVNRLKCDITDLMSMKWVKQQIQTNFGEVYALLHLAGNSGGGMMRLLDTEKTIDKMSAKVVGAINIEKTLLSLKPKKVMYFSSMSCVNAIAGQTDYCASNHFLDLLAKHQNQVFPETEFISVNWPTWQGTGMASEVERNDFAITAEQGVSLFLSTLETGSNQYLISPLSDHDKTAFFEEINNNKFMPQRAVEHQETQTLESLITNLFQDCLGQDDISKEVCFYNLGGDSLTVLDLFDALEASFPGKISLKELNQDVTIDSLIKLISNDETPDSEIQKLDYSQILKAGNGAKNMLIHPIGGELGGYRALIKALPDTDETLGIKDPLFHNNSQKLTSVETLAAAYLGSIKTNVPKRIIAWSFGALIAWEMIRLLEQEESEILDSLDLIFIDPPSLKQNLSHKEEANGQNVFIEELKQQYPHLKDNLNPISINSSSDELDVSKVIEAILGKDSSQINTSLNQEVHSFFQNAILSCNKNQKAMLSFEPVTKISLKTQIFIASRNDMYEIDNVKSTWGSILNNVSFYEVNADHYSIMEQDNVEVIVEQVLAKH